MARLQSFNIDSTELSNWILSTGNTPSEISELIGREAGYLSSCLRKSRIGFTPYKMLLRTFNLPDGSFMPTNIPQEEPKNKSNQKGWSLDLQAFPDKVRLALLFDNSEVRYCFARVRGDTELDLVQAISYAAHMLFKYTQSEKLEDGSWNPKK